MGPMFGHTLGFVFKPLLVIAVKLNIVYYFQKPSSSLLLGDSVIGTGGKLVQVKLSNLRNDGGEVHTRYSTKDSNRIEKLEH